LSLAQQFPPKSKCMLEINRLEWLTNSKHDSDTFSVRYKSLPYVKGY